MAMQTVVIRCRRTMLSGGPQFEHPLSSSEGRIERAVFTLREATSSGHTVGQVIQFLQMKGCNDDEIAAAVMMAAY